MKREITMEFICYLFIPLLFLIYTASEKKIKRLNKRIKALKNKWKEIKKCLDLEELKGQTVSIRLKWFLEAIKIVDYDEDWVKLEPWGY